MILRRCPDCGCALDPGERCDCQDEKKEAATVAPETTSGKSPTASLTVHPRKVKELRRLGHGYR